MSVVKKAFGQVILVFSRSCGRFIFHFWKDDKEFI